MRTPSGWLPGMQSVEFSLPCKSGPLAFPVEGSIDKHHGGLGALPSEECPVVATQTWRARTVRHSPKFCLVGSPTIHSIRTARFSLKGELPEGVEQQLGPLLLAQLDWSYLNLGLRNVRGGSIVAAFSRAFRCAGDIVGNLSTVSGRVFPSSSPRARESLAFNRSIRACTLLLVIAMLNSPIASAMAVMRCASSSSSVRSARSGSVLLGSDIVESFDLGNEYSRARLERRLVRHLPGKTSSMAWIRRTTPGQGFSPFPPETSDPPRPPFR